MTELDLFIKVCKIAERGYEVKSDHLEDADFIIYAEPKGMSEQDLGYYIYDIIVSVADKSLNEHKQGLINLIEGKLQ